ncbi:MAG TPA: hypothetical protein VII75_12925 [Thermoanaerobaculia bacterium]|nr:hypothetical protein [Thermoanaerobaculia bacterium]
MSSLLFEQGGPRRGPATLAGREVLVGPDPEICKVKGVMFAARRELLTKDLGERTFYAIVSKLSPGTMRVAMHPVAGAWYDFANVVEYDRAIWEACHKRYPYILDLIGAASAELGITRVFSQLDEAELYAFLEKLAEFHQQYQKYGHLICERTDTGARMHYHDYPCYSPIFCASGNGFLLEAIMRHGGRDAEVVETKCHCRGDAVCTYEMTWG